MNTIKINGGRVKMIAHRGLSGLEKENTCSAFVAAGNREGIFGIETDVHVTADGQYIIIHDDDTKRVGLDQISVEGSSYETLRGLRLADIDGKRGRRDLCLPSLEEYLGICKKYEKTCVLELKNQLRAGDVYKIISACEKADCMDKLIVISFQLKNLIYLRRRYPELPAQYLLKTWDDRSLETLKTYHLGLDMDYKALTKEIVDQVHEAGFQVNCWTVNDPADGERLIEMGVDYITTNILE